VLASKVTDRALSGRMGHAWVRSAVGASPRRSHLVTTRDLVASCPPDVRAGWLAAMAEMDLRDGIAGIGVPTTVLVGTQDRLTPPKLATELADTIPGAKLVTLAGKGHMLPLEAADEVAEVIAAAH
jgi:pimeloyl-ACP methyl ester carboxylesterase